MKRLILLAGGCLSAIICIQLSFATPYTILSDAENGSIYGGDGYDQWSICDGSAACVACTPAACVAGGATCATVTAGSDGCTNATATDSFCLSFNLVADCEYLGGAPVCGGPMTATACAAAPFPACAWTAAIPGCAAAPAGSNEDCENCKTVP